jgi:hypothetical protein
VTPVFQTNDDIAMSMNAHGYGNIVQGTPNLIYTNVLWGSIIRLIPNIFGVPGYSTATFLVLFISAWALLYFLRILNTSWVLACSSVALVFLPAVASPQFTVNAGLLAISSFFGLFAYFKQKNSFYLLVSGFFAFLSYLIRDQEFFYVFLISLPVFSWMMLLKDRRIWFSGFIFLALCCVSIAAAQISYNKPEWEQFNKLQTARIRFTDKNLSTYLINNPEEAESFGYSPNDIRLISSWFFVDQDLANPDALNNISSQVKIIDQIHLNWNLVLEEFKIQVTWPLIYLLVFSIVFFILSQGWKTRIIYSWLIFISVLIGLGVIGHHVVSRIHYPILSFLGLYSVIKYSRKKSNVDWWVYLILVACIGLTGLRIIKNNQSNILIIHQLQKDVQEIKSDKPVVAWGASFPIQYYYPVFSDVASLSFPIYQLGANTLNPNSVANQQEMLGQGFLNRLFSEEGFEIISQPGLIDLLTLYCEEHYSAHLERIKMKQYSYFFVYQVRCVIPDKMKDE